MDSLTIYRQSRVDGGVRTGVDCDGVTVLHHFTAGSDEENPALAWFIDMTATGPGLPPDESSVRDWLLQQVGDVRRLLNQAAQDLEVGIDPDLRPFTLQQPSADGTLQWQFYAAATQRVGGRELAHALRDLAQEVPTIFAQLDAIVAA